MLNRVNQLSTYIGADNIINGNINATSGDVLIAGKVHGSIIVHEQPFSTSFLSRVISRRRKNVVHVQAGGEVQGPITAESVIIDGKVNGNVFCTNLEVGAKGMVKGDVSYAGDLKMSPGARINGRMIPTTPEVVPAVIEEPTAQAFTLVVDTQLKAAA